MRPSPVVQLAVASCTLFGISGAASAQYSLRQISGTSPGESFGSTCAFVGDVDGDHHGDFVAGTIYFDSGPLQDAGRAQVISGATGAVLYSYVGTASFQGLGQNCASAGDVDHDGRPDFYLLTHGTDPVTGTPSELTLYSGGTGLPLRFIPVAGPDWFSVGQTVHSIAVLGDVNGDGVVDHALGAPRADGGAGWSSGVVHVVSGSTGAVLKTLAGAHEFDQFGAALAGIGDATGDGVPDLAVVAPNDNAFKGAVTIFDGATWLAVRVVLDVFDVAALGDVNGDGRGDVALIDSGSRLRVVSGASGADLFSAVSVPLARILVPAGDQDGDGKCDALIGAPQTSSITTQAGAADLRSGATGKLLRRFFGAEFFGGFGESVTCGDTDADGVPDLLIGEPFASQPTVLGRVHLFEAGCQTLYAYGDGCPGTGGFTPQLSVTGCVASGPGSLTLSISNADGGGTAVVIAGVEPAKIQHSQLECPLLVKPPVFPALILPLSGAGAGTGSASVVIPADSGQITSDIFIQAFTSDPVPRGYAGANGFVIGKPGT